MTLQLGFPHPDYLRPYLSSRQLTGWMAYYSLEPWGFWGEWARTGRICETLANPWRGKGQAPFKPQDFMPTDPAEAARKQSTAEMKAILEAIAAATGAKRVKRAK